MVAGIRESEVQAQVATYGGAFGTGILLGWIATTKPAWGATTTLIAAAGGAIGALMTKGFASQMLEGMGAAAMGALGASLPTIFGGGTSRQVGNRPPAKMLGPGTNVVANAIASSVKSAVEF